jgi:hypothetical protein
LELCYHGMMVFAAMAQRRCYMELASAVSLPWRGEVVASSFQNCFHGAAALLHRSCIGGVAAMARRGCYLELPALLPWRGGVATFSLQSCYHGVA